MYLRWIIQAHEEQGADTFEFASQHFVVHEQVFNPNIATSSLLFAEHILHLNLKGKRVLDAGCGSGILSIAALLAGAEFVVTFDSNPRAVASTQHNLQQVDHSTEQFEVIVSSTPPLDKGKFDFILCNPPFFSSTPKDNWEVAFTDQEGSLLSSILQNASTLLQSAGQLLLITGGEIDLTKIAHQLTLAGLHKLQSLLLTTADQQPVIHLLSASLKP